MAKAKTKRAIKRLQQQSVNLEQAVQTLIVNNTTLIRGLSQMAQAMNENSAQSNRNFQLIAEKLGMGLDTPKPVMEMEMEMDQASPPSSPPSNMAEFLWAMNRGNREAYLRPEDLIGKPVKVNLTGFYNYQRPRFNHVDQSRPLYHLSDEEMEAIWGSSPAMSPDTEPDSSPENSTIPEAPSDVVDLPATTVRLEMDFSLPNGEQACPALILVGRCFGCVASMRASWEQFLTHVRDVHQITLILPSQSSLLSAVVSGTTTPTLYHAEESTSPSKDSSSNDKPVVNGPIDISY